MPGKRYVRRVVDFLDGPQMEALLAAPDLSTWIGRRDHTMLLVALRTGLRVSEIVNLRWQNIIFGQRHRSVAKGKVANNAAPQSAVIVWLRLRHGSVNGQGPW